ncbi:MAG: hypothetical protein JWO83_1557, partial [Caulobacteraceae bacterium]|nr:hypothetical protein [Caulobacteraceae bacterium]
VEQSERSLRLFAEEVLPAVRHLNTEPLRHEAVINA